MNDLSRRLTSSLPGAYKVEVTQQVANLDYSKNTVGEVGVSSEQQAEDFKAEITIKGPLEE
ncbi:MAG: hypothetical protein HYU57_03695 [Micavibrio aeruginosavorus]|nr:hypothetical protein [Micavibrio aeruginosavorus]